MCNNLDKRSGTLYGVLAIALLLGACADSNKVTDADHEHSDLSSHIHHSGPASGVWPPQPVGMEDVAPLPASAKQGALTGVLSGARQAILNNPRIRDNLGSEYLETDAFLSDNKSANVARFTFFNYTTNETIEVTLGKDGTLVSENFDASEFQPTEHPQEVEQAVELGRANLINNGFDLTGLVGTAMLAFPPESAMESVEKHFYSQRMLYVTFGPGQGELPLYTALVNVSAGSVVNSGLVK